MALLLGIGSIPDVHFRITSLSKRGMLTTDSQGVGGSTGDRSAILIPFPGCERDPHSLAGQRKGSRPPSWSIFRRRIRDFVPAMVAIMGFFAVMIFIAATRGRPRLAPESSERMMVE